ncbi:LysR family transcriptional regulator [Roseovarius arcticus]|uniref:LysR family transcriptional regulator n=1 Tax=Roseovarius arcticus TaxID=2547404 RepID=UPI0011109671|nr:LysR family transcriptional regulator [Roseovarius arcticus]
MAFHGFPEEFQCGFATFEVATKYLSFTQASNELHITQAAVSQQIRGLEKALGAPLFARKHNSLEWTAEGQTILAAVGASLDQICTAIDTIGNPDETALITCSGTNAAVTYWLKPFVDKFSAMHPDIRFVLLASDENDTLRNFDEVDLSLICGNERCEVGEIQYFLFPEVIEPVCSPDYQRTHGPFPEPASLFNAELLELHRKHWSPEAIGWLPITRRDWFEAQHCEAPTVPPRIMSNSYPVLIEAALAGEGAVLGRQHLVRSHILSERLCTLTDAPLRVDRGNYLKVNKASLDRPYVQKFVDFILAEVNAEQPGVHPPVAENT